MSLDTIIGNRIIIDDTSTWPDKLIDLLYKNNDIIEKYLEIKGDYYFSKSKDKVTSSFRNVDNFKICDINKEIEILLSNCKFIAFHCTRLTLEEIEDIEKHGLKLLDNIMMQEKITKAFKSGYLTKEDYTELILDNLSDDENRKGRIFATLFKSTLSDESSVGYFFKHWGGEALYKYRIIDYPSMESAKKMIENSVASIVVLDIDYNDIVNHIQREDFFYWIMSVHYYVNKNETPFEKNLTLYRSCDVVKIIKSDDIEFEKLSKSLY